MCKNISFIGEFNSKADSKFRVSVPAPFRKEVADADENTFVLQKNLFDDCIDMYPLCEWKRMVAEIRFKLNFFNKKHILFFREFCRGTKEVNLDSNGRILLPKHMLELVDIDKEMVFIALDSKIQIWNEEKYGSLALDGLSLTNLASEIFKK